MSEADPIKFEPRTAPASGGSGAHSTATASPGQPQVTQLTRFDRFELDAILRLYGRMVAAGEWRDYAIDMGRDQAIFAVYRRSSDVPLYSIVKDLRLARKQGAYSVVAATGLILKRGHDLTRVLAVLDKPKLVMA